MKNIVLVFFVNLLFSRYLLAQNSDFAYLQKLIYQWQSEKEKLYSGIVWVDVTSEEEGKTVNESYKYHFNFPQGCLKGFYKRNGKDYGAWIQNPEYLAQVPLHTPGGIIVDLATPNGQKLDFIKFYDPRVFGFSIYVDYSNPPDFQEMLKRYKKLNKVSIRDNKDGNIRVEVNESAMEIQFKFVSLFSKEKGGNWTDVSYSIRPKGSEKEQSASSCKTTFQNISDMWLPVTSELTGMNGVGKITFKFKYESLNSPIDENEFKYSHIGAPRGTLIVDSRINPKKGIIIGKIGGAADGFLFPFFYKIISPITICVLLLSLVYFSILIYKKVRARRVKI